MTNLQRIVNLLFSVLMVACGVVMLLQPDNGLLVIAFALGVALMLYGVGKLVFYIRMARHMTGGLALLFIAIIAIDIGVFAAAAIDSPHLAVALYLIAYNLITGALSIARGIESKLFGSPWVIHVVHGLVNLVLAGLCVSFINSGEILIWVFCVGLFYNAGVRLVSVFKPTEIIYIQ